MLLELYLMWRARVDLARRYAQRGNQLAKAHLAHLTQARTPAERSRLRWEDETNVAL